MQYFYDGPTIQKEQHTSTQIQPECAATEISLQHTPRHMQHSPHDDTWDREEPNTVKLQLPQKLALLQGRSLQST
jgi:hypothetical protein